MKSVLLVLLLLVTTNIMAQSEKVSKKDLKKIYKCMKGHFSSEDQSKKDSTYFNISLTMAPLWKDDSGYWLYVEQAVSTALNKPYRQRIYHLYLQDDTTIVSKVYEIQNPKDFIGAQHNKKLLKTITKDMLIDRKGCAISLHKKGDMFMGSTPGKECLSTLRGATYATSEVSIFKDKIISWDRGWSKDDKYVWGAEFGGYHFRKIK